MLLVRTPSPFPTESLLGYILRVSEANGYDTPRHVLDLAGHRNIAKPTVGIDISKLAAILGKSPNSLQCIAYARASDNGREVVLLGHSIRAAQLALRNPRVCPRCVSESGFIEASFDIATFTACPIHSCTLVSRCPACNEDLSWFRPGLLRCKCGHAFDDVPQDSVSPQVISLMSIQRDTVLNRPVQEDTLTFMPAHRLRAMRLSSLIQIISSLGRYAMASQELKTEYGAIVENAAMILADWPNGFRDLLRNTPHETEALGLRKRFEHLYSVLFRNKTIKPEEVEFLREDFIRFGLEEWKEGLVDQRLLKRLSVADSRRFVSKADLVRLLGVRHMTINRFIRDGLIHAVEHHTGKSNRFIADATKIDIPRKDGGMSLGVREAAKYIGMPVSVLKKLRESGHFKVKRMGRVAKAYHVNDLNDFVKQLVGLYIPHQVSAVSNESTISLSEAMRYKFLSDDGKADLIREILGREIVVTGHSSHDLGALQFLRSDIERFISLKRSEAENNTWSFADTARRLHCDPQTIPAMIRRGFLNAVDRPGGRRIVGISIETFDSKYISLARLAKERNTLARRLKRFFKELQLPLEEFQRSSSTSPQAFILRRHTALYKKAT